MKPPDEIPLVVIESWSKLMAGMLLPGSVCAFPAAAASAAKVTANALIAFEEEEGHKNFSK